MVSSSAILARLSVSRLLTVLERTGEFTQVYRLPVAILFFFLSRALFGNELTLTPVVVKREDMLLHLTDLVSRPLFMFKHDLQCNK